MVLWPYLVAWTFCLIGVLVGLCIIKFAPWLSELSNSIIDMSFWPSFTLWVYRVGGILFIVSAISFAIYLAVSFVT
jgi:hypothetical protein